ncbi:uncharacterized protein Z518_06518 [Rhinocladiella mackenziei CBS 650.93]|uniref:Rhinocladiella mackenziei CBS 650.93 unplaced genomic scaffold supercont1.5, whole genome shotgun sequence n=1 Tax=Rhinocladiella mackenziei CBS 650.93 TaxID=1442369 RepID=A0A0D2GXS5_9EURO|nr:uncharacterized protein Z518_06518 [Rhinocladiella mackenziei CBS 650.93]KIX02968.1 hypothetical protein Z518_06518 [Rhinocladiella mackenziei CBS 650.93]
MAPFANRRIEISVPPIGAVCTSGPGEGEAILYLVGRVSNIAARYDFVAYSMMVISANRLASLTKSSNILEDVLHYQSLAVKGLQRALSSFSKDNSDAVLSASILLLFQQRNGRPGYPQPRPTYQETQVAEQMQPWQQNSSFFSSLHYTTSRQWPSYSNLEQSPSQRQLDPDNAIKVSSFHKALRYLFNQGINSLAQISLCTRHNAEASATVRGLRDLLYKVRGQPRGWREQDQFRVVFPFSSFMKSLSTSFISISDEAPFLLATMAHIYAVNVALSLAFSALNTPVLVPTQLKGIDEIASRLRKMQQIPCHDCGITHGYEELMTFPVNALGIYQQWAITK